QIERERDSREKRKEKSREREKWRLSSATHANRRRRRCTAVQTRRFYASAATRRSTRRTSSRRDTRACGCAKCASKRQPTSRARRTRLLSASRATETSTPPTPWRAATHAAVNFLDDCYFSDLDGNASREEEDEAASWLLPNPKTKTALAAAAEAVPGDSPEMNTGQQYLFPDLDLDCGTFDPKVESQEQNSSGTDGVVPVENRTVKVAAVNENCYELDFTGGSKGLTYGYNSISHSVSSSSLEVGVVPDGGSVADVSYPYGGAATSVTDPGTQRAVPLTAAEREARVMRYREKRKNRKFEKTIRYASRKAYAEMRPRIKGRFAKRTDTSESNDVVVGHGGIFSGFGLVPTF
ncbi:PREDICTED: zinc finger protein CONSTANS-LIKE 4, partial [Brassica oleracea var. oleracea]|uniref:zinc finger protein CONSTANS-LIKE 4 n=1 Tax=Brassica oleracea var. oleracea TaxID=109376 RepID=UPI0006A6C419